MIVTAATERDNIGVGGPRSSRHLLSLVAVHNPRSERGDGFENSSEIAAGVRRDGSEGTRSGVFEHAGGKRKHDQLEVRV